MSKAEIEFENPKGLAFVVDAKYVNYATIGH